MVEEGENSPPLISQMPISRSWNLVQCTSKMATLLTFQVTQSSLLPILLVLILELRVALFCILYLTCISWGELINVTCHVYLSIFLCQIFCIQHVEDGAMHDILSSSCWACLFLSHGKFESFILNCLHQQVYQFSQHLSNQCVHPSCGTYWLWLSFLPHGCS